MKILITGGCGYIGSHVAVALLERNFNVSIIDNFINSKKEVLNRIKSIANSNFSFYEGDITDRNFLKHVMQHKFDVVIHFAGLKSVSESFENPTLYYNNNVIGTYNLVEEMLCNNINTIIFSSSATVYGDFTRLPISENAIIRSSSPYGQTKILSERILAKCCSENKDFSACVLRFFNPIGSHCSGKLGDDPKGTPKNLLPYIFQVAAGELPFLNIYGNDYPTKDGTCIRDYIHISDLVEAHIKALEYSLNNKGIDFFNIGTGIGYSVLDVVNTFNEISKTKIQYKFSPRRNGDVPIMIADPTKANKILKWKSERDLSEMIYSSLKWNLLTKRGSYV